MTFKFGPYSSQKSYLGEGRWIPQIHSAGPPIFKLFGYPTIGVWEAAKGFSKNTWVSRHRFLIKIFVEKFGAPQKIKWCFLREGASFLLKGVVFWRERGTLRRKIWPLKGGK